MRILLFVSVKDFKIAKTKNENITLQNQVESLEVKYEECTRLVNVFYYINTEQFKK